MRHKNGLCVEAVLRALIENPCKCSNQEVGEIMEKIPTDQHVRKCVRAGIAVSSGSQGMWTIEMTVHAFGVLVKEAGYTDPSKFPHAKDGTPAFEFDPSPRPGLHIADISSDELMKIFMSIAGLPILNAEDLIDAIDRAA